MATNPFNATRFVVTFAGIELEATGEDTFFKATKKTPRYSSKVDLSGNVSRSQSNDDRWDIEMSFLQTDHTQLGALKAVVQADKLANNGSGISPNMTCKNLDTGEIWSAVDVWIVSEPDFEVKGEPGDIVVKFEAAHGGYVVP